MSHSKDVLYIALNLAVKRITGILNISFNEKEETEQQLKKELLKQAEYINKLKKV